MAPKKGICGEGRDSDTIDRLSDLADAVLHRILSRVPIKDAVGTSLVSKRWQRLWRYIPKLKFDQSDFRKRSNFMNLVDRALLLRDSFSVEKFTLSCDAKSDMVRINSWIESVVMRNVQKLRLDITLGRGRGRVVFPSCLFRCETLTRLQIGFDEPHDLITPSSVCLSSLKDLRFTRVRFVDYGSVQNLLRSCPALEDLAIWDCHWMDLGGKAISAPNLQRLIISDADLDGFGECECCPCKMVINGPNVKFFDYHTKPDYAYCLVGSSSLNKAKIYLRNQPGFYLNPHSLLVGFCDQLQGLHNVRSLTLPSILFRSATGEDVFQGLPIFGNMTELELGPGHACLGSKALATLLAKSPCLRILKIEQYTFEELDPGVSQALEPVPPCFKSQLKKIIVDCLRPYDVNLDWIALLLEKATVLEHMVIQYKSVGYDRLKHLEELPRGSKDCKILLLNRSYAN